MRKIQASPAPGERGQSLTELAISFMLLVLLLAVVVDFGRLFFSYIAVREAAEEGAIYAALYPEDAAGVEARVRGSSSDPVDFDDPGLVSVTVTNIGAACAGNSMRVTVSYDFSLTMPLIGAILGSQQFPLSADAISTVLRPPCP